MKSGLEHVLYHEFGLVSSAAILGVVGAAVGWVVSGAVVACVMAFVTSGIGAWVLRPHCRGSASASACTARSNSAKSGWAQLAAAVLVAAVFFVLWAKVGWSAAIAIVCVAGALSAVLGSIAGHLILARELFRMAATSFQRPTQQPSAPRS